MKQSIERVVLVCVLVLSAATVFAQSMPTTQPGFLQIYREEVKPGESFNHAKTEAGWPAAFEKAKSPYFYIALVSMTGPNEAWFVSPFESHAGYADSLKREADDPVLSAELERLHKADAAHIEGGRSIHAVARKDLSHGAFPAPGSQRFYEITVFRVRPGHEADFAATAKAYAESAGKTGRDISFRTYEIVAGMPGPSYLVFSSVVNFADFDKAMADSDAVMKAASEETHALFKKFFTEGVVNIETHRFRLDPMMSYVPKDVRAQDPAFWMPKRATTKGPVTKPAPAPKPSPEP